MKRGIFLWTTQLHFHTLSQLDVEGDFIFIPTSGRIIGRIVGLIKTIPKVLLARVFCKKIYMPRIASFEFLLIRWMLSDQVILTTDGLSDTLEVIEPRLNLKIFKSMYRRQVDMDFLSFNFIPKDEIVYSGGSKNVILYEKLPTELIEDFVLRNVNYEIYRKKKGEPGVSLNACYIVTFPSTVVFEYSTKFPKEKILIIRSSELALDPITSRRHERYEEYFFSEGFNLLSLKNDNLSKFDEERQDKGR